MALLGSCTGLTKSFGSRLLFENIALGISEGERLGLIGRNGAGKSTLLRILAGQLEPDGGSVSFRRNTRIGYVPQEAEFPESHTVDEVIAGAIAGEHLDELERAARINQTLGRAGFTDATLRTEALSGGWKRRLAIAREIARRPTCCSSTNPPTTWISRASGGWRSCCRRRPSPAWWSATTATFWTTW